MRSERGNYLRLPFPPDPQSGGGQADEDVALPHGSRVEDPVDRDAADEEAGQVVGARGVHPRHLRRLAAEERAAVHLARVGDRADHPAEDLRLERGRREVVKEEQRIGAHREGVVHAVVDEIGSDALVPIEQPRELELRPDAVGGRDEHGVGAGQPEQAGERADVAEHLGSLRRADPLADARERVLGSRDVHAGLPVVHAVSRTSLVSSSCTGTR